MIVQRAYSEGLDEVFSNLAPERAAELTATAWHDNPRILGAEIREILAVRRLATPHAVFALFVHDDAPAVAIGGVLAFGPGLGGMIWAATPAWRQIRFSTQRWFRHDFTPNVLEKHYRRVEFTALAADKGSRRWLHSLGFTVEGRAYRQGKHGEDFVHFAWLNPNPNVGIVHA